MKGLLVALSFLTRVPMGARPNAETDIGRAVPWFPFVGAGIGLFTGIVYLAAARVFPELIAAIAAVAAATLLTGAFHEDGLADTADAFGGSFDRGQAVQIFHDPRHGTYGVLALVLSVSLRIACLASLAPTDAVLVLVAAHALSRAGAVQLLGILAPAGAGLGASYGRATTGARLLVSAGVGLVIGALCSGVVLPIHAGLTALAVGLVGWLSARKIEGVTGDVLGAAQQVAELAVLAAAVALG